MVTAVETVAVRCSGATSRGGRCRRTMWLPVGTRYGCGDHPLHPDDASPRAEHDASPVDGQPTPPGPRCQVVTVNADGEQINAQVRLSGQLSPKAVDALNTLILEAAERLRGEA